MSVPPPGPNSSEDEPFEQAEARRRSARPLVWLLLVIALLALVWYVSREPGPEPVAEPVAPATTAPAEPLEEVEDELDDAGQDGDRDDAPRSAPSEPVEPASPAADRAAEPLARVQPEYPRDALRLREEGTVLLRVEVDAQGNATSVEIESSSRSRTLDRAAREAVSQWTFRPAIEGGRPVASTVTVPVDFRVE